MRLRGLVFERFVTFERAEVNLCDENGAPLDVVLFVGEGGAGKTSLLRGVSGLLSEAAGAGEELAESDVRRSAASARCRVVFDDVVDGGRVIITLEKELLAPNGEASDTTGLRATPPDAFERWRRAVEEEEAPRAAFSVESHHDLEEPADGGGEDATDPVLGGDRDPLFDWLFELRGGPKWDFAVGALDRVLWPYSFNHMTTEGDLVFATTSGLASSDEIGDGFESVLVMALELLRLSTDRPNDELVYVIDDIDAHLHPRWQSRIIGDLRRAFPRVQLVATTHSPWVVASVEPYQVFRLERPAPDMDVLATRAPQATTGGAIVRVSDRIQKGAVVSHVMDLAFGTPELPGPRWAHHPTLSVRREVLQAIDPALTRGAVVYVLPEPVHARDIRDAFGEPAIVAAEASLGHIFFVDREPGVAWGHPCDYVFRTRDGKLTQHRAIWPPANLDRFVPIGRG